MPVTNRPAGGNQAGNQERWNQPLPHDSGTIQQVKDQAKDVVDSATELAGKAKDKVQEIASNVATQVKDRGQELKDMGQDFAANAAERAEDLGVEVTKLVRRYPVQALLVGFGIGLLMGRVSRI